MKSKDLAQERDEMIRLLERRGIVDERVLAAMADVPRERFVAEGYRDAAYSDRALPLKHGATISQPYMVAFMTQAANVAEGARVLEVGTGSGYQAAVLACMGCQVYSMEIDEALADEARRVLDELGYAVHVRAGDAFQGWPEAAPFDAIIVTAAAPRIPKPLLDQLEEGGRLIIPVGEASGDQVLEIHERRDGKVSVRRTFPVRFVPMTGEAESSLH